MRRHVGSTAFVGLLAGTLTLTILTDVQAQEEAAGHRRECSERTLHGEYLVSGGNEARVDQPNPDRFPLRAIAVWNFDGQGGMTGFNTQNRGGRLARGNLTATYTMDAERCVATLTFSPRNQWELFITRDGREGVAIRVDVEDGFTEIGTRSFKKR